MATNASFPPYEYVEGDQVVGIDPEIAAAVCEKMGYDLEIVDTEFDSLISGVASGKYDFVMAGMTVTDERKQMVSFSDTYATGVQVVIVKEGSAIASVDDLFAEGANHAIGVQTATTGETNMAIKTAIWLPRVKDMGSSRILIGEMMGTIMPMAQRSAAITMVISLAVDAEAVRG